MNLLIPSILIALPGLVVAQTSARDLYLDDAPRESESPLGARIQIRKAQQGRWRVAEPGTTFRAGDKLRIEVESKSAAYLYIVSRGSDGSWDVLFPEGNLRTGSRVRPRQMVSISAEFDEKPGEELVCVILFKQPVLDRQDLIRSVSSKSSPTSTGTAQDRDLLLETAAAPEGQAIFAVGHGRQMLTKFILRHQ